MNYLAFVEGTWMIMEHLQIVIFLDTPLDDLLTLICIQVIWKWIRN